MNEAMREQYDVFELYQALRSQLLEGLSDDDLGFTPGGESPPLGALCREIGEVEHAYIESFKTGELDFSYRYDDARVERSLGALREWYEELDAELEKVLATLSADEVDKMSIQRSPDFSVSPRLQLEIYKEALLIFYGKVSVYLKTMGKERPSRWESWIA